MSELWRIVDADLNRVTEGLRVVEDLMRFVWEDGEASLELKKIRLTLAEILAPFRDRLIISRDAEKDPGLDVSRCLKKDHRSSLNDLITANFKRAEEGTRSLEEYLKLLGQYQISKEIEVIRFKLYTIEKRVLHEGWRRDRKRFIDTDLYGITASEYSRGRSNREVVQAMLLAGIRVIQYREKDKKIREKFQECIELRDLTAKHGALFIVNDDLHLAMAVSADGIHLGQDDLPPEKARELAGEKMVIGWSTHSPEQALEAVRLKVDYIGVGPIFPTFTKKDVCAPVGLEYLEYVVKHIPLPFVAIGGIKEHNISRVFRSGARTIALVTEIVGAEDIQQKVENIRGVIAREKECMKDV